MRPIRLTFVLASAMLAFAPGASAQETPAPSWSSSIGCALQPDTEPLRLTLPLEVLDHLERMSNSVFVHAFLIRYIADEDAGEHRLSRCARDFVKADLNDFRTLRQRLPDAGAIIEALRAAEQARLRTVELRDSARQLPAVVAELRADSSQATLDLSAEQLAAARTFCGPDRTGACGTLFTAVEQIDSLRRARGALQAASDLARQGRDEVARLEKDQMAAAAEQAADSSLLVRLETQGVREDSAAIPQVELRIGHWRTVIDSLATLRTSAVSNASAAETVQRQAADAVESAREQLSSTLGQLETQLRDATGRLAGRTVTAIQGSRIGTFLSDLQVPPAQAASANPTTRSANILLELTDFIIARMRREAVNSFIVTLHGFAGREPLLREGFRETWGLMQGLDTLSDGRLSAVDVGRIPLTTWRATLAGDFVTLPVTLLDGGPEALCRGGAAAGETGVGQQGGREGDPCRERVAVLKPLVPVARRLLEGDAIFDILRDATTFAPPQGPSLPADWRYFSQGLSVLAALAETYLAQGYSTASDLTHHPYMLTAQSVAQVPQEQRAAFVRLLLVRVVPSAQDVPGVDVNAAALENAVVGATRLLERLASRPVPAQPRPADAGLLLRGTFDALLGAADVARVIAPERAAVWLEELRTNWRAVSGTLESLASRNFGLALARTTVLLRELRGVSLPAPVLTFTALASSLSEAQDGDQVRAAFEAAASPVGGWQAKRYGSATGSITAFPGFAFGFEQAIGGEGDPEDVEGWATTLGGSLPIGFEVQVKLSKSAGTSAFHCTVFCGLGVFVPLVDLGALLSYRVNGPESVEPEPNATVRQVFAPGLYISLALTRTVPLNLLLGGQLMPSLRSVGGPDGANRSAFRFGVGIGMDILLYRF